MFPFSVQQHGFSRKPMQSRGRGCQDRQKPQMPEEFEKSSCAHYKICQVATRIWRWWAGPQKSKWAEKHQSSTVKKKKPIAARHVVSSYEFILYTSDLNVSKAWFELLTNTPQNVSVPLTSLGTQTIKCNNIYDANLSQNGANASVVHHCCCCFCFSFCQAIRILAVGQKRRIYDITNVLEGAGLIMKVSKSMIKWM